MSDYISLISIITDEINFFEQELVKEIKYPDDSLIELIKAPAKRVRPILAILFLKMFAQNINLAHYNVLTAVELAHTASLIHDDIVDFANKRRGLQTISDKFGDKIGVLTGDYLLSLALKKITLLNNNEITQDFLKTFSDMAQGEINQFFSHGKIPTLVDYINKTKAKTAGLFCSAIVNCAKLSGLNEKIALEIGENFGIAFQIKNDLDNAITTKSDIKNGIFTAPVIFSESNEITPDGIEKTKILIEKYIAKVENALANCPFNEYNEAIEGIIQCLIR